MSIDFPLSKLLDEIQETMLERHRKYSARNIADSPGGALNGVRVRLHDKLARINNAVDNDLGEFADESFRDAFVDVAGYGLIGLLVLDGDWPGVVREKPLDSLIARAPGSLRWSELRRPAWDLKLGETDAWRPGTRFAPDASDAIWERGVSYWRAGFTFNEYANLTELVDHFGYEDGTITEPAIAAGRNDKEKTA